MAMRNADVVAKGGQIISILMDGPMPGVKPTQQHLSVWAGKLPYTAVRDNVGTDDACLDFDSSDRDTYFIYALATMELVSRSFGFVAANLTTLDDLLSATGP